METIWFFLLFFCFILSLFSLLFCINLISPLLFFFVSYCKRNSLFLLPKQASLVSMLAPSLFCLLEFLALIGGTQLNRALDELVVCQLRYSKSAKVTWKSFVSKKRVVPKQVLKHLKKLVNHCLFVCFVFFLFCFVLFCFVLFLFVCLV